MIIGWTEKQRVWALLEERDLDGYADGSIERPTEAPLQGAWDKKDRAAMRCIKLTIGDANMGHILGAATSKQMWDQIAQVRERRGAKGILSARRRLYRNIAEEGVDMRDHISKFRLIQEELLLMGSEMTDIEFTIVLLQSLPESWDQFTQNLIGSQRISATPGSPGQVLSVPIYSSYKVCGILLEEYERRQERVNSNTAFVSQGPFKGKKPPFKKGASKLAQDQSRAVCHNCGKPRHYIRDCWSKGGGKEGQGPKRAKGTETNQ